MRIGSGGHTYDWIADWARIPDSEGARTGWAHHGIVVTEAGNVVTYHQSGPTVLVFDRGGKLLRSWNSGLAEGHGMTLVKENGSESLWIADSGAKRQKGLSYQYPPSAGPVWGQAVRMDLDGRVVMRLQRPDLDVYREGKYQPTSVAVNEERFGGNGDIWLADGYGQSYVHRYDKAGRLIGSINGQEGEAGAFNCPHGIYIDRRKSEPELYIADRSNHRVQVYDPEGRYRRCFGADFLTNPSAFATYGESMIVAELHARLAVLDINDNLVCYLGDNHGVAEVAGWPNVTRDLVLPGAFNSPHGVAVDGDGNLYVAEWLIGGRITKLARTEL